MHSVSFDEVYTGRYYIACSLSLQLMTLEAPAEADLLMLCSKPAAPQSETSKCLLD